jgi:hypothetical protein
LLRHPKIQALEKRFNFQALEKRFNIQALEKRFNVQAHATFADKKIDLGKSAPGAQK